VRTAHAAGAGAVVIPERRAAGVTDVVAKAAAGALEHLPLARVGRELDGVVAGPARNAERVFVERLLGSAPGEQAVSEAVGRALK